MSSIPEYLNRTLVRRAAHAVRDCAGQPQSADRHLHPGGTSGDCRPPRLVAVWGCFYTPP
jgi:hypothetical protein